MDKDLAVRFRSGHHLAALVDYASALFYSLAILLQQPVTMAQQLPRSIERFGELGSDALLVLV